MATRTIAYRIVQEALSNARRHSEATMVRIRLDGHDHGLRGRVVDNGRGFAPGSDPTESARIGIVTMRERAEMA